MHGRSRSASPVETTRRRHGRLAPSAHGPRRHAHRRPLAQHVEVDGGELLGGAVPAQVAHAGEAGAAQAARLLLVVEDAQQAVGDGAGRERVDEDRRAAGRLGQRRGLGGDDGRAAGHRLDDREAEALVERRERERGGAGEQAAQAVRALDPPEPAHAILEAQACHDLVELVGREPRSADQREGDGLRAARAHDRPRLEQAGEVLARLQVAEEDDVGLLQAVLRARRGGRVVVGREAGRDAVGEDLDAVEREPGHGVDEVEARVLGADHDARGAPHRPRHEAAEGGAVGERHEALVAQVGDVVHRQHGRAGQRRRQHVEPVVEGRPVGPQPHRQGGGGARVVRSDRHPHRHDAPALGDLRRERGGIAQVGQDAERRVEPRERGEHVDREGLVTRAPAADDVGVERDDGRHRGRVDERRRSSRTRESSADRHVRL